MGPLQSTTISLLRKPAGRVAFTLRLDGYGSPLPRIAMSFRAAVLLLLLSGCVSHGPLAPSKDATTALTCEQWRDDLRFLAHELPRRHINAFHTVSRERFDRAVAELGNDIPTLKNHEIVVRLRQIVAMVGDGHTQLFYPTSFRNYPLALYWFGDDLRVRGIPDRYARALGTRLVAIGGVDIRDATARVGSLIPQEESPQYVMFLSPGLLTSAETLDALRVVNDLDRAAFTFVNEAGERFTTELTTSASTENTEWVWAAARPPLLRRHFDQAIWFLQLPESKTVYCSFRRYPDWTQMRKISRDLAGYINHHGIERLLIDLRINGGGDYFKGLNVMIPALKTCAALRRPGGLFIAIGRGTFSAAVANACHFRKELDAILVGEPTGGRPIAYSENRIFNLPHSHLSISYSIRHYRFQEEDTPGVMPDVRIDPSWELSREGRDPVIEWVQAYKADQASRPPGRVE